MGVASLGKDHTWEINLAARVAWMSYVGNLTQSEIANRLGVSSARVHRLIQLAKQHGIIRISIEGRPAECMHLEAEIAARFNLKSCTISPFLSDKADKQDLAVLSVGQAAGQVLAQHLTLPATKSLAIDPFGATLVEAVRSIPQVSKPKLQVWPTHGCLARDFRSITSPVLSTLELRTHAAIGMLPVPYAPGNPIEHENFKRLPSVQESLAHATQAQVVVGQIQRADIVDEVTPIDLGAATVATTATSRFLGNYFDQQGEPVDAINQGLVCLPLANLAPRIARNECRVFGLAAGVGAQAACLSVLAGGLISDVVIDEALATALLSRA